METQINIKDVIVLLINNLLKSGSSVGTVLLLRVRIESSQDGKSLPFELFEILIHRPRVYTLVSWKRSTCFINGDYDGVYAITANHDSTWKYDGFSFLNFYDGRKIISTYIDEVRVANGTIDIEKNEQTLTFKEIR